MDSKTIFLDGRMVKAKAALLNSLVPGAVQGTGVFETMRVCGGTIEGLKEHLDRLSKGLKIYNIRSPYSRRTLEDYLYKTIEVNGFKKARIRIALWRERRRVRIAIVCQNYKGYPESRYRKGYKAIVSDVRRKKTKASHIKSLDYACFRRAYLHARTKKCDEAILLNNQEKIVEGSRTNIFFAKRGVLYSPSVRCGALNGITRQKVIKLAREANIPFKVVEKGVNRLAQADEAFVTNSLVKIMPLTVLNGKKIGSGKEGPLTNKLRRLL